jgi:tRNA (mo5U34)-methyltransferase
VTGEEPGRSLRDEVGALDWYHTLDLGGGVVTPGWFDTREVAATLPWPDLAGKRCLDVGTFDGFWAFEMERRGAAEVMAVDLLDPERWDWPVVSPPEAIVEVGKRKAGGRGFEIAKEALGSKVERSATSVYDLDPGDVGTFDFVYVGSLLLHLRDPVRALERVRAVAGGDGGGGAVGEVLVVDAVDLWLTTLHPRRPMATLDGRGRPWWWKPNVAGLVRMVEAAGMEPLGRPQRLFMPPGADQLRGRPSWRALVSREGRDATMRVRKGDPHAAVRARPRR